MFCKKIKTYTEASKNKNNSRSNTSTESYHNTSYLLMKNLEHAKACYVDFTKFVMKNLEHARACYVDFTKFVMKTLEHAKACYVDFTKFVMKNHDYTRIHYTPTPMTLENLWFSSCVVGNILIMLHGIVQINIYCTRRRPPDGCMMANFSMSIVTLTICISLPRGIHTHGQSRLRDAFVAATGILAWGVVLLDLYIIRETNLGVQTVWMMFSKVWENSEGMHMEIVTTLCIVGLMARSADVLVGNLVVYLNSVRNRTIPVIVYGVPMFLLAVSAIVCSCLRTVDGVFLHTNATLIMRSVLHNQHTPAAALRAMFPRNSNLSVILFIIDGLPMREFSAYVPEENKLTSVAFRNRTHHDLRQCSLLQNHFAGSSYTYDGIYAILNGMHSVLYSGEERGHQANYPIHALRHSGHATAMFHYGLLGFDFCRLRKLRDGGGTLTFETSKNVENDDKVVKAAVEWLHTQTRPIFLVIYLQGPHLRYHKEKSIYERLADKSMRDARIITAAAARFSPMTLITTDHGDAMPYVDKDCQERCVSHGFAVHGNHATQQVSHIPLWICPQKSGVSPKFAEAALGMNLTSAVDIMPTILDLLDITPALPTVLWSSGVSWLRATQRRYVYTWSRIECGMALAAISGQGAYYFAQDRFLLSSFRYVKHVVFRFPLPYVQHHSNNETSIPGIIREMVNNVVIPAVSRSVFPLAHRPDAMLLKVWAMCVYQSEQITELRQCPVVFRDIDNFLWVQTNATLLSASGIVGMNPESVCWRYANSTFALPTTPPGPGGAEHNYFGHRDCRQLQRDSPWFSIDKSALSRM